MYDRKNTLSTASRQFTDHGIAAAVCESRGAIATVDAEGRPLILALAQDWVEDQFRISLLIVDAATGETEQHRPPSSVDAAGTSYSIMLSSRQRLYFMLGPTFFEFDLTRRAWTFHQQVDGVAMCLTEAPDGSIYAVLHPTCELVRYMPEHGRWQRYEALDPQEDYPQSVAVADDGWVYVGIGTERFNLVGFDPTNNQRAQLIDEQHRDIGTAKVRRATDGRVYGTAPTMKHWLRFEGPQAEVVDQPPPPDPIKAIPWGEQWLSMAGGHEVRDFSVPDKSFVYVSPSGERKQLRFDYESAGAGISSLAVASNGLIHGSTMHPMHWFTFNVERDQLHDLGAVPCVGGGNVCDFAPAGDVVYGAAYARGHLLSYDPTRPWMEPGTAEGNPRLLHQYLDTLARPRGLLLHPNQRHLIMCGFPGYGRVAGGLAVFDVKEETTTLLENDQLIPGHSTLTIRVLPGGDLIGGTSVATVGGAKAVAKQAALYRLDWQQRRLAWQIQPFGSASQVRALELDPFGCAYALTGTAMLYKLDIDRREVLYEMDFSAYGQPIRPGQSLRLGEDGLLYMLLTENLLRISPHEQHYEHLATLPTPATAGTVVVADRLYYAAGSHLWSFQLNHPEGSS